LLGADHEDAQRPRAPWQRQGVGNFRGMQQLPPREGNVPVPHVASLHFHNLSTRRLLV
jgi:hypothetical protein